MPYDLDRKKAELDARWQRHRADVDRFDRRSGIALRITWAVVLTFVALALIDALT